MITVFTLMTILIFINDNIIEDKFSEFLFQKRIWNWYLFAWICTKK